MSQLEVAFTSQHLPDGTPAKVLAWLKEFSDLEVTIPVNDMRTASVSISIYDPAVLQIKPYVNFVYVLLYGNPIFWGPMHGLEWSPKDGTVVVHATDPGLRLENHFIVHGDGILESTGPFAGRVPIDYRGMRLLRDAADNLPSQNARNVPVLGVGDGSADTSSSAMTSFQYGDEIWSSMKSIAEMGGGPDFLLQPNEIAGSWPYYVTLDCFDNIGNDRTFARFDYGFGKDNLEEVTWSSGGKFVTHAHVTDADGTHTQTFAALDESAAAGVYVSWEGSSYKVPPGDEDALLEKAKATVEAYRHPVEAVTATLRNEDLQTYKFFLDYFVGDTVIVEGKAGYMHFQGAYWIQQTVVHQADRLRTPQMEHTFIVDLGTFSDPDITEG